MHRRAWWNREGCAPFTRMAGRGARAARGIGARLALRGAVVGRAGAAVPARAALTSVAAVRSAAAATWVAAATWAAALGPVGCNADRGASTAAPERAGAAASAPGAAASAPGAAASAPGAAASAPSGSGASSGASDRADSGSATADHLATSAGEVRIVPIHHATLLLEWNGKAIYADPTGEGNYAGLPRADVVLITHGHQDHLSPPTIGSLQKGDTVVVAPAVVASTLTAPTIVVLKNGESKEVAGVPVEAVAMYNLARGPSAGQFYHDKGQGNGYVLTFADKRIYLSGDTECVPEVKALRTIDVAFLCMNLPYTMPPAEAAQCVASFLPTIVYPYHYRASNLEEFRAGLSRYPGIEVRLRAWYP